MRVHITGNAGSGNSTLAEQVGSALNLPVSGLDQIVWQAGWKKTPPPERLAREEVLVSRPSWVIEGVSSTVRQAADVIVFLDVPRRTSYWRCAKRNWKFMFRSRPGLPPRCPEFLILPQLTRLIWHFPERVKPQILTDMHNSNARFFHVTTTEEREAALAVLGVS